MKNEYAVYDVVGWFGIPDGKTAGGLVHAVLQGKPICGTVMRKDSEFQWCSFSKFSGYIECRKCKKMTMPINP